MGYECVVPTCNTSYPLNTSDSNKKRIFYHIFPKDEKLRQIWIRRCGTKILLDYDQSFVCSKHFKEDDYERDVRGELLNLPMKKKLKLSAIPSRNLGDQEEDEEPQTENKSNKTKSKKQRYEHRGRKKYTDVVPTKINKTLKRTAEVNSTSSKSDESKLPLPKKKKGPEEDSQDDSQRMSVSSQDDSQKSSQKDLDDIDAGELQKLLNIILERIHCLEQELEGLTHIMEDIKGRIEKLQSRN